MNADLEIIHIIEDVEYIQRRLLGSLKEYVGKFVQADKQKVATDLSLAKTALMLAQAKIEKFGFQQKLPGFEKKGEEGGKGPALPRRM